MNENQYMYNPAAFQNAAMWAWDHHGEIGRMEIESTLTRSMIELVKSNLDSVETMGVLIVVARDGKGTYIQFYMSAGVGTDYIYTVVDLPIKPVPEVPDPDLIVGMIADEGDY